ncbi:MAG: aminotransferase class I/II-fold pyridoxal phosphate-dependent enzyme [Nitrososphaerota archaeon]|nr:aminotransferase class I/II-fold pyridoxal phosphate-dependent enzyme [Nitrososphaerota archaeon]
MRPEEDELFSWVLDLVPKARYNLTSSGLGEPALSTMGIDTSYQDYGPSENDHFREQEFAEAVARLYRVEPANIVPTAGASESIFLIYSTLGVGRRAVVPLPNYPAMFTVPRALGMGISNNLVALRSGKTILGVTDPNNPTGERADGEATSKLTSGKDALVFVNETYKEFSFPGSPATNFGTIRGAVVCSTMTKFYGLGRLRVGWVMADRRSAQKLMYAKWAVSGHDSEYSLWIATQVLKNRRRFVERARKLVSVNRRLVRRFLAQTSCVSAEVGVTPFCLVRYKKGPSSVVLAKELFDRTGVLVTPGDFFGAPKAFRLCYTADEKTLKVGLQKLSEFLNHKLKSD